MKKNFKKKIFKKENFFCENEKLNYFRFLGHFYYHGTMNLPCISKSTSIRNWVTFCGKCIDLFKGCVIQYLVMLRYVDKVKSIIEKWTDCPCSIANFLNKLLLNNQKHISHFHSLNYCINSTILVIHPWRVQIILVPRALKISKAGSIRILLQKTVGTNKMRDLVCSSLL